MNRDARNQRRHRLNLVTSFVAAVAFATVGSASTTESLRRAEALATRDEGASAIEIYERILDDGESSVDLHYNLGTLYLEAGDVGRAAFHLESALFDRPGDDDVQHNLNVMRASRQDDLDVSRSSASVLSEVGQRLSPAVVSAAFFICLVLAVLSMLGFAFTVDEKRRKIARTVVIGCCGLWVMSSIPLAIRVHFESSPRAVVVVDDVEARKAPAEDAAVVLDAHAGLSGTVVDTASSFVRLRLENGLEFWIPDGAVRIIGRDARVSADQ